MPSAYPPANAQGVQAPVSPPVEPGNGWLAKARERAGFAPLPPGQPRQKPRTAGNNRLGFMIAGLCILAGALLLVFVYFLGVQGSPNNGTTSGTQTSSTPTAAPMPSPTITPSPTATAYPGQQYIDNAQTSSSPPPSVQVTNTFKTNQKIYVTFDLHPNGQSGAVCFIWYLNGQQVTTFTFPAGGNSRSSYGYAIFGGTGSGSVELYWANDATCSNDLLAQQVSFTVTK
jgi:hypothetical protein